MAKWGRIQRDKAKRRSPTFGISVRFAPDRSDENEAKATARILMMRKSHKRLQEDLRG